MGRLNVLLRIATVIFLVEGLIMLALLMGGSIGPLLSLFIDIVALVLIVSPIIYFWVINPYISARDETEGLLEKNQEELESRVRERTRELVNKIDKHKRQEDILRQQRFFTEQAESIAGIGNWMWNALNDTCVYCSEGLARIHGLSVEEYKSITSKICGERDFMLPDDWPSFLEMKTQFRQTGEKYSCEYRIIRPDGEVRWVRDIGATFNRGDDGKPISYIGVIYDITEQKQANDILARSHEILEDRVKERTAELRKEISERKQAEEKLQAAIEMATRAEDRLNEAARIANLGYWAWDEVDDRIIDCSEGYALIYGITKEQMLASGSGKTDFVFIHPDDQDRLEKKFQEFSDNPENYDVEYRNPQPDGTTRYIREIGNPIFDEEGQLVQSFGIVQDITKSKQIETALQKAKVEAEIANRSKTEFLANMSHDLRTPLNAIMGFSEMMNVRTFGLLGDPHYEEYARDIHNSGLLLVSLIDDILDISRIEAGKYELNEENLDIPSLIQKSVKMISPLPKTGKLHLVTDIEPGLPMLRGDERTMTQILNNLLSNAVKFTPVGGKVTITVKVDGSGSVNVLVADTGEGMSSHDIIRALKPFEQADSTHSRHHEGTGLGLHLCQKFIELHDGEIKLQSKIGKGTTVTVLFPPERTVAS